MSAPFVSTIGTGGTYSTLAAWAADMPANITAAGGAAAGNYSALLKNQAFSSSSQHLNLAGITTDATHGITIACEAGASFRDNASASSNALRINGSNGALLVCTGAYIDAITIAVPNVTVFGIQVDNQASNGSALNAGPATGFVLDSCVLQSAATTRYVANASAAAAVRNNVLAYNGASGTALQLSGTNCVVSDNTIVRTAANAAAGTGIACTYSGNVLKGNAVFGYTTPISGTPDSASDYNATERSTLGTSIPGTHNLVSQAFSSCFVNTGSTPANADWRIGASSPLKDAGVAVSGITVDIIGTTRSTPDIGAWEYSAGTTATSYTATATPTTVTTGQTVTAPVTPNGSYTGTITGTPSGTAATGLSAVTKTFSASSTPQSASWTPTVSGTLTITWTNSGGLTNPANSTITVNAAALSATAIVATPGRTSIGLSTTASGGTPPYSYLWQAKYDPAASWSTLSGATTASPTHSGIAYRTPVWYRVTVTDSAGSPASVTTATICAATRPVQSVAIGFIGDSITAASTAATTGGYFSDSVTTSINLIATDNRGVGSTTAADWLPGAATWAGTPVNSASNCLTWAKAAFATSLASATIKIVHIMLGTNDCGSSVTPATYGTNMAALVANLVASGYRVILSYPPFMASVLADAVQLQYLRLYQAQLDALVDNVNVFQGDQDAFLVFANNPALLADGVHPTTPGYLLIEKLWADAIVRVMEREGRVGASGSATAILANGLNGGFQ